MPDTKAFRIGYGIIIILLIILLANQVNFIFQPLVVLVQTLFFPFLLAGILFYLFRPLVRWLEKKKIPRTISILLIYLAIIGLLFLLGSLVAPVLQEQLTHLIQNLPAITDAAKRRVNPVEPSSVGE